jgi:hypothetical protein
MEYELAEYRHGLAVAGKAHLKPDYDEFLAVIRDITDEDIIRQFNQGQEAALKANKRMAKSASDAINKLIDERLKAKSWLPQAPIFGDKKFKKMGWALDFAKETNGKGSFSVEVVFNNAGSLGWNLIKLVLACEQNHVEKAIETEIGIIVLATKDMESAGGFDGNAIATFENAQLSLKAMQTILTATPIIIVGLKPPRTFTIEQYDHTYPDGKTKAAGRVVRL